MNATIKNITDDEIPKNKVSKLHLPCTILPTTASKAIPLLMSYRYLAALSLCFLVIRLQNNIKFYTNTSKKIKALMNKFKHFLLKILKLSKLTMLTNHKRIFRLRK